MYNEFREICEVAKKFLEQFSETFGEIFLRMIAYLKIKVTVPAQKWHSESTNLFSLCIPFSGIYIFLCSLQ